MKQCHDECGGEMWTVMSSLSGSACVNVNVSLFVVSPSAGLLVLLSRCLFVCPSLRVSWSASHGVLWFFMQVKVMWTESQRRQRLQRRRRGRVFCLCVCACPSFTSSGRSSAGKQRGSPGLLSPNAAAPLQHPQRRTGPGWHAEIMFAKPYLHLLNTSANLWHNKQPHNLQDYMQPCFYSRGFSI